MGLGVLFGLQRYIKKIGYKQDVKPQMLSRQVIKRTFAKSKIPQISSMPHTVKYLIKSFDQATHFMLLPIYKSLTKNYLVLFND